LIPERDLTRALQPLSVGKSSQRILVKSPKTKEIEPTHSFSINESFSSAFYRVKIQQASARQGEAEPERNETRKGRRGQEARDRSLHCQDHEVTQTPQPQHTHDGGCGAVKQEVPTSPARHQEENRGPHRTRVHEAVRPGQKNLCLLSLNWYGCAEHWLLNV